MIQQVFVTAGASGIGVWPAGYCQLAMSDWLYPTGRLAIANCESMCHSKQCLEETVSKHECSKPNLEAFHMQCRP